MADTQTEAPAAQPKAGNIISAGAPQIADIRKKATPQTDVPATGTDVGKPADTPADTPAETQKPAAAPETNGEETTNPHGKEENGEVTEEQLKSYFEKQGIKFDGNLQNLKEKLEYTPTKEPTPEEKEQFSREFEKRLVSLHIDKKGTPEQFAIFKSLTEADPKELGLKKVVEDLVKDGFSAEAAAEAAKKMHFTYSDEEIDEMDDDQKENAKKQRDFGAKKLANRGTYIQKQAKAYLDSLAEETKELDAEKLNAEQHSSTVEDAVSKYQRKETLQLGEIDGEPIAPIEHEISDSAFAQAKELLSDKAKLEKFLLTEDGNFNIGNLLPHFIRSLSYTEAVKKGYLTGSDRQVEHIKATFDSTPPGLGGSTRQNGTPGKITGYGKTEIVRRQPAS